MTVQIFMEASGFLSGLYDRNTDWKMYCWRWVVSLITPYRLIINNNKNNNNNMSAITSESELAVVVWVDRVKR